MIIHIPNVFFFCERQENKEKLEKQNAQSDTVKKNKLKAVAFFYW